MMRSCWQPKWKQFCPGPLQYSPGTSSPQVVFLCSSRSNAVSVLDAGASLIQLLPRQDFPLQLSCQTVLRPVPSQHRGWSGRRRSPFVIRMQGSQLPQRVLTPILTIPWGSTQLFSRCAQVKDPPKGAQTREVQETTELEG